MRKLKYIALVTLSCAAFSSWGASIGEISHDYGFDAQYSEKIKFSCCDNGSEVNWEPGSQCKGSTKATTCSREQLEKKRPGDTVEWVRN